MRNKLIVLAVMAAITVPAPAVKPMTAEQLAQTLGAGLIEKRSDDAVARQLADAKLTTRLTGVALQRLIAVSPGPKTTQALHAIADASSFLEPPPGELPSMPAPDFAKQKAIIGRTVDYVAHTLPAMPNFLATRVTQHYVDTTRGLGSEIPEPQGGLFLIGTNRSPIAFRDGRETDDPTLAASLASSEKKNHVKNAKDTNPSGVTGGLTSWGEFGPILGVVLLDAAKGKLSWARWEQDEGKPVAVFQFAVDRSISHYSLNYCCESYETDAFGAPVANGASTIWKPGYHGRIEVDPEAGTILRISIEAELLQADPIQRAAMMVEYGPVKIGDDVRSCPTRSVALSVGRTEIKSHGELESINRLRLNEVEFTDYHRFGSESTLITGIPPESGQPSETAQEPAAASTPVEPAPSVTAAVDLTTPAADLSASAALPQPPAKPSAAESEANREIVITAAAGLPELAGNDAMAGATDTGSGDTGSFTIKTTTRSVDVDLVAADKHGKPVADLKQDEITLFDNGRQQQLREFFHAAPGASVAPAPIPVTPASDTFSNTAPATTQIQDSPDLLILLMDESHLAFLDLNRAREETLRFLATSRPSSRIALYSMTERGFHVIQDVTQDHALVVSRLKAWTPNIQGVAQAQAGAPETRNTMQVDTRADVLDLSDLQGNGTGTPVAVQANNLPLSYALRAMVALARHFASVPGRKSMAWISGDSALAGWNGMKSSPQLEAAMQHTREALNEARIVLYAVDASAPNLGAGGFDATMENPNSSTPVIQNGPLGPRAQPVPASMQGSPLGIQGPARQLAESTGGRAISKGSDLKAALDGIDRESSSYYELAFEPDTPADGKFHTLLVKIPRRKDVVLRYRTGYLYAEDFASTQQRFQQAVWSPQDATGIALTAEVMPAEAVSAADSALGKRTVRLRIAFPGLALAEKGGRWTDQLYIFMAVRDDAAQKAEVSGDTMRLNLNQATYDSGIPAGIPYQRAVDAKSKLGSVRVIVVDANSGKMGSVTLPSSALHP